MLKRFGIFLFILLSRADDAPPVLKNGSGHLMPDDECTGVVTTQ